MSLLLGILTFVLILISIFMVLIILAQRAKSDGGVGAALGGGMTEAAFGAESGNVLSRGTTYAAVAFFILSFVLYLGHLHQYRKQLDVDAGTLPAIPDLVAPEAGSPFELPPAGALDAPVPTPSGSVETQTPSPEPATAPATGETPPAP